MTSGGFVYEYTFTRQRIAEPIGEVRTPRDAADVLARVMGAIGVTDAEQESFVVLALDVRNRVIGFERVYRGNAVGSNVRVGEAFRMAVRVNAVAVVFGHNHPSGMTMPSMDDVNITRDLAAAGKLLDISVLDHIIVGEAEQFTSMRAAGALS